ncbi:MAG: recombinase family protein [Methylococcaceae bacterium]|nr:recombinase family protein [Methylococcaceae bacterium]
MKALRNDDILNVWKRDRLSRNLRHLMNTVHELAEKDVRFKVLTGVVCRNPRNSVSGGSA